MALGVIWAIITSPAGGHTVTHAGESGLPWCRLVAGLCWGVQVTTKVTAARWQTHAIDSPQQAGEPRQSLYCGAHVHVCACWT
jgi:hypothetical protein